MLIRFLFLACVQLWKRSGAWFYKGLPKFLRPSDDAKEGEGGHGGGRRPRGGGGGGARGGPSGNVVRPIRGTGGTMRNYATWNRSNGRRECLR